MDQKVSITFNCLHQSISTIQTLYPQNLNRNLPKDWEVLGYLNSLLRHALRAPLELPCVRIPAKIKTFFHLREGSNRVGTYLQELSSEQIGQNSHKALTYLSHLKSDCAEFEPMTA